MAMDFGVGVALLKRTIRAAAVNAVDNFEHDYGVSPMRITVELIDVTKYGEERRRTKVGDVKVEFGEF